MVDEQRYSGRPAQLQEAIDTIVQSFDHPQSITVNYTVENGQKRTTIDIPTGEDRAVYELIFDGQDDNAEPELRAVDAGMSGKSPE